MLKAEPFIIVVETGESRTRPKEFLFLGLFNQKFKFYKFGIFDTLIKSNADIFQGFCHLLKLESAQNLFIS